ncbi:AAA family ATPase [candidate division KSB1 bacterium]|nr:AAA family ATPase [candidate division KSB1 bacterium]NIR70385.1 AAA family ATPase [candidate division KSB1 bacterium]NIS23064.1 AAA family ATPase [candidate division KSB1 bacterium]NIT71438.1 AAA family ATPase [candidate division KSB1 bacterium]NIU25112.1 AAA family ATPase [candidate division KSB1 bacterium]
MQNNESQQIFVQLSKILKRRKWILIICVMGILGPIIYFNETATPVYEASTMVVFEEFVGGLSSFDYDASREILIFNRVEEIKSLAFAEDVTNSLDENILQRIKLPDQRPPDFDFKTYVSEKIEKNIAAMPVSKSNIVRISVQWPDPHLAKSLANAAAQSFLERNYRIRQEGVSNVRHFIQDQLDRVGQELNAAEQALKNFKEENRITSFNRESEEILRRLTEAEVLYNQVKGNRGSTEKRLETIQVKIAEQKKDFVPLITDVGSPWTDKLKQKLVSLQSEKADLRVQGYAEDHPKIVQLNREIEETKKTLTNEAMRQVQSGNFSDPQVQLANYVNESFTLQVELEAYKAQEAALKNIVNQYEKKLATLPAKEYNLIKLTRERDAKSNTYMNLLERLQDAKISEAEKTSSLRIIDHARLPEKPIKPRKKLNVTIGLILGTMLGLGIAFVLETFSSSLDSTEELENLTQWPVLASIPRIDKTSFNGKSSNLNGRSPKESFVGRGIIARLNPKSGAAESYRMLRTNLQFHGVGQNFKTLLFTSIGPEEGKSTTISNVAIALANLGKRVLLVDADMRKPVLHSLFGLDREPGLSELLVNHSAMDQELSITDEQRSLLGNVVSQEGMGDLVENFSDFVLDDQIVSKINSLKGKNNFNILNSALIEAVQVSEIENLKILSSGKQLKNPSETVASFSMKALVEEIKTKFDIVMFDSAPVLLVPETMILSAMVDGVVFVVDSKKFNEELLLKAKSLIKKANANVVGTVLNNVDLNGIYKSNYYYKA